MMRRKILSVTGTRSDYGLMTPVYRRIAAHPALSLDLIVTAMHFLPAFHTSLQQVRTDAFGRLHFVSALLAEDSPQAMALSFGLAVSGMAPVMAAVQPDIVLLQGDRGEMLAAAIAAAHLNIPIVHMSGGDRTGSIDDSIRHAISKFAHVHLTTCAPSSEVLRSMGEESVRIVQVGEPGLDLIREFQAVSPAELASELSLDLAAPILLATLHPVTTEAEAAPAQMTQFLDALETLGMQTVMTYPNTDSGGRAMIDVLEARRGRPWLRIAPNLGSDRYLSLLKIAAVIAGNSSSGIFESPSFRVPAVNVGTRQHGRLRASNVIDVGYARDEIVAGVRRAFDDAAFRSALATCVNPYGDGNAGARTIDVLTRLRLDPGLLTKWMSWPHGMPLMDAGA